MEKGENLGGQNVSVVSFAKARTFGQMELERKVDLQHFDHPYLDDDLDSKFSRQRRM